MIFGRIIRKTIQHYQKLKLHFKTLSASSSLIQDAQAKLLNKQKRSSIQSQQSKNIITQLPRLQYEQFTSYMHRFYNSISQNGRVNGQHIVFVTGAEGVGKSQFIETTIKSFKKNKKLFKHKNQLEQTFNFMKSPESFQNQAKSRYFLNQHSLFIRFNHQHAPLLTQQAFFDYFCSSIITNILTINQEILRKQNMPILTSNKILQICIHQYYPKYFINSLKQALSDIMNGTSLLLLNNKQQQQQFSLLCQEFSDAQIRTTKNALSKDTFQIYQKIVEFISKKQNISELQAALRICLLSFSKIQWENRPKQYEYMWYQSGIQRTDFLFHVLNYICGFGAANQQTITKFIQQKTEQNQKQTYIDMGNHIDVIMIIQNLQKISCYGSQKFNKWFDSILIKLHNSSNLRTHFPVVIQIDNSFILRQIRRLGKYQVDNPTVMELPGYFKTNIHRSNLVDIFDTKIISQFFPKLGRNPSVWFQSVYQMNNGVKVDDMLTGNTPFCKQKAIIFQSKLNKLALYPKMLPLIDKGKLKSTTIMYLNLLKKTNGLMSKMLHYYNISLFDHDDLAPYYKLNILFNHYYYNNVDIVDSRYLFAIDSIIKSYESRFNIFRRIQQRLWRKMRKFGLIELNRGFTYRQLRHSEKWETEIFKRGMIPSIRPDYHLRDYYGSADQYKYVHFDSHLQDKYNM